MLIKVKSSFVYFKFHFGMGIKYAIYFVLIAAAMGFIYGAFGGVFLAPIFVSITYLGIFAVLNSVFAILLGAINFVVVLFGKGSKRLTRYFAYSLAFLVVLLLYFICIKYSGFKPF